jgi:hypothetical protein
MAKTSASDAIMPAEKMKPLLTMSKREPVQAALALTGEGEGVMLLDKKAKPRKVLAMLRASASKVHVNLSNASLRFGRAEVDPDYDSSVVRLFVNKEPPGPMRVKLTEVVKHLSYQKVEFVVDPSLETEGDDEDAADAAETAGAPAGEAQAAAPEPMPETAGAPDPNAGFDAASLVHTLAEHMKHIPAVIAGNPAAKAGLVKLASEASASLKAHNLAAAAAAIDSLGRALNVSNQARPAPPATGPDAAALTHALADLMKRIPAAISANPQAKAELVRLAGEANAHVKAHDLAGAAASMETLRKALDESGHADAQASRELRARIADVQTQAALLPDPAKSEIQARARRMLANVGEGDPAKIAADVDALEDALARAAKAARTAQAAAEAGDTVTYRKLSIAWRDAQDKAGREFDRFIAKLLSDGEIQADPRFEELKEAASDIADQMPEFAGDIEDALGDIDGAGDQEERATARANARQILAEYSRTLEDAGGLRELQALADEEYGGLSFFTELRHAIDSLEAQLATRH